MATTARDRVNGDEVAWVPSDCVRARGPALHFVRSLILDMTYSNTSHYTNNASKMDVTHFLPHSRLSRNRCAPQTAGWPGWDRRASRLGGSRWRGFGLGRRGMRGQPSDRNWGPAAMKTTSPLPLTWSQLETRLKVPPHRHIRETLTLNAPMLSVARPGTGLPLKVV